MQFFFFVCVCLEGDGILVWSPSSIQPVNLTIQVSDQTSSSLITPVLQLCNCLNGGRCQYNSVAENLLLGKFQVLSVFNPAHRYSTCLQRNFIFV